MADTSALDVPAHYLSQTTPASGPLMTRDWAFCRWLAHEARVIAIPVSKHAIHRRPLVYVSFIHPRAHLLQASPFYSAENKHLGANYVRFAFCKGDDTLREAVDRISRLVGKHSGM